jgi:hypothetical protein
LEGVAGIREERTGGAGVGALRKGVERGARGPAFAFIGGGEAGTPAEPRGGGGAQQLCCLQPGPDGLGGRPSGPKRVGPSGSARSKRIVFFFFSNLFLMRKQFQKKLENCLKERKKYFENHKNSRKIPRDRLRHEKSK